MVFDALNEISFGKSQSSVTLIGQLKKYHLNMSRTDSETVEYPKADDLLVRKKMSQFVGTTLARRNYSHWHCSPFVLEYHWFSRVRDFLFVGAEALPRHSMLLL